MEYVRKLETVVAKWYKNMPHLPANAQKWLAQNAWWLILVWVVLGAFGIFSLLMVTFFAGAFLSNFGTVGATIGGLAVLTVTLALLFSIVNVVLGIMAINPLKLMRKKGWTLIFVIVLIHVVAEVVSFLFSYNAFSLVWGLLFAAVGAYFLFEIHDQFGAATSDRKKVPAKQKKAE